MIVVERDGPAEWRAQEGSGLPRLWGGKTGLGIRLVGPATSFEHSAFWNWDRPIQSES